MTLCDTGPIVALLNRNDPGHFRCSAALGQLPAPLVTTQACVTEAMHLIGRDTGYNGQQSLWNMIESGAVIVAAISGDELRRTREFMVKYRDVPCDYADATLLTLAEIMLATVIFTLDSHFHAYRIHGKTAL